LSAATLSDRNYVGMHRKSRLDDVAQIGRQQGFLARKDWNRRHTLPQEAVGQARDRDLEFIWLTPFAQVN
jgi:hypothetical protein